ncbi:MAG: NfeD family protein [Actinomycetota bacterium]|nr:NfeD family protein [Actinomycetota bacterium]
MNTSGPSTRSRLERSRRTPRGLEVTEASAGWPVVRVAQVAVTVSVLVAVAAAVLAVAAVAAPTSLRWGTGAILAVLLGATWLLCAHAGGHAWFVPMPALVLGGVWAFTVSARSPSADWWLVGLSAAASAGAAVVAGTALRQRLHHSPAALPPVRGAGGVAVTDLAPVGIVRVAGERWSAMSLSGNLPAGAPVHVVKVSGVRLEVWSEVGSVTDASALNTEEDLL